MCYWKFENVAEVQRQFKREFHTDTTTVTYITKIRDDPYVTYKS